MANQVNVSLRPTSNPHSHQIVIDGRAVGLFNVREESFEDEGEIVEFIGIDVRPFEVTGIERPVRVAIEIMDPYDLDVSLDDLPPGVAESNGWV